MAFRSKEIVEENEPPCSYLKEIQSNRSYKAGDA